MNIWLQFCALRSQHLHETLGHCSRTARSTTRTSNLVRTDNGSHNLYCHFFITFHSGLSTKNFLTSVLTHEPFLHVILPKCHILYVNSCKELETRYILHYYYGRGIAQAVSRRLPTAAARFRALVWSSGICGGQNGTGEGFLRVLQFPLPILIPPTASHPSSIVRVWYNIPVSDRRTKWTSLTSPQETKLTTSFLLHYTSVIPIKLNVNSRLRKGWKIEIT
jgi:hypothetical protein